MLVIIVVTARVALTAGRMLVATILVGKRLYDLDQRYSVVTFDHQFADASNLFSTALRGYWKQELTRLHCI
jgi:hypothetical protein